jgi:hypothetical protein
MNRAWALLPLGLGIHTDVLGCLFLDRHRLLYRHPGPHHIGDGSLLALDGLLLVDDAQLDLALAQHLFQVVGLGSAHLLDLDLAHTALLGHLHRAQLGLLGHLDGFLRALSLDMGALLFL